MFIMLHEFRLIKNVKFPDIYYEKLSKSALRYVPVPAFTLRMGSATRSVMIGIDLVPARPTPSIDNHVAAIIAV
jgi:hypothetical protein